MLRKQNPALAGTSRPGSRNTMQPDHIAAPALAQFAKRAIMHLAHWGLLPSSGACWLLRRLGLRSK